MPERIEIFFSYAHEDEHLMDDVRRQLIIFERKGRILKWHDRQIRPGEDWRQQIDERLNEARIILLFMSPHFIESRYCSEVEGQAALARHERGEATVVPVVLRPCAWQESDFGDLQALPSDGRPITGWPDRDEVCLEVAQGVIGIVDELSPTESEMSEEPRAQAPAEPAVDMVLVPRNPVWPIYHEGNYTANGRFAGQFHAHLVVGSSRVDLVEFECEFFFADGRDCVQRVATLSLDGEPAPLFNVTTLEPPAALNERQICRLYYRRDLQPPGREDLPIDLETGGVRVTLSYRRGAELQLLREERVFDFRNGDLVPRDE